MVCVIIFDIIGKISGNLVIIHWWISRLPICIVAHESIMQGNFEMLKANCGG